LEKKSRKVENGWRGLRACPGRMRLARGLAGDLLGWREPQGSGLGFGIGE